MTKIIAVTACPSGVAHTYMAAEALESAAKAKGWEVKVETCGSIGLENELTAEDVASADMVILTKDIGIKFEERFAGKTIVRVNISDAVKRADAIMSKIEAHGANRLSSSPARKGGFAFPQEFLMTNRISRLKTALFANTREISLERALLYTASHRQTEGEPVILRRAKATAYILEHVEISIRDEELIAGNRTVKPRAGIMSPEMDPYWLLKELDQFPTRPQDRFAISEEDKRIYREELFPYWEKRSMKDFINGQMTDEVKAATNTQIFSINQTDKGRGTLLLITHAC